jgi:hypothetical protein
MAAIFANVSFATFIPQHERGRILAIVDAKAEFLSAFRPGNREHPFSLFDSLFDRLAAFRRDFG